MTIRKRAYLTDIISPGMPDDMKRKRVSYLDSISIKDARFFSVSTGCSFLDLKEVNIGRDRFDLRKEKLLLLTCQSNRNSYSCVQENIISV